MQLVGTLPCTAAMLQATAPGFAVSAWYAAVPSCGDFGARGFGALIQAVVASIAVN